MEINTPEIEFVYKNVIDIDVEFMAAPAMRWTINDTPEAGFREYNNAIVFTIVETDQKVRIERRSVAWSSVRRRVDKIPVRKENAQQQPSGRVDVNRR